MRRRGCLNRLGIRFALVGLVAVLLAPPHIAFSTDAVHRWSKRMGDAGDELARALTTDLFGNVFLTAMSTSESVDLGGGPLNGINSQDTFEQDIVLAKLNRDGTHLWSQRFSGSRDDVASSLTTDPDGNVILAGFSDSESLDLGGAVLEGSGQYDCDILVAKYSAAGSHLWSKRLSGASYGCDSASSVAADGIGSVFLAGSTQSESIDLGGGPLQGSGQYDSDILLAKYSATGQHLWSRRFGGSTNDESPSIVADAAGNVIVVATSDSEQLDLGGGVLESAGSADIVIAKYNTDGEHLWSKRLGGTGYDWTGSVASDGSGNVFLAATSGSDSIEVGGDLLATHGAGDLLVAKFESNGAHMWSKLLGGTYDDHAVAIAASPSGEVLLAGNANSRSVNLGGQDLSTTRDFAWTDYDIVIARYSPEGEHVWSRRLSGDDYDFASSVDLDPAGRAVLIGSSSSSSIDLGGGPFGHISNYGFDLVLASYEEDAAPPMSSLEPMKLATTDPLPVESVRGNATDDLAGIESVTVTFAPIPFGANTEVSAILSCSEDRLQCAFSSEVPPWPGFYSVSSKAEDRAGNIQILSSVPIQVLVL
jgi:beta-propeller repeat-containing protein